jgi:glucan phosphoethanolaminetransferase (alkaline phosphatase superfamily)
MALRIEKAKPERRHFTTGPKTADVILPFIEILLLSIWLVSIIFFSFAVAPGAFDSLPSHQLAGLMVTSMISKVEMLGIVIGPVLLIILILNRKRSEKIYSATAIRAALLATMTVTAAISRSFITAAMVTLRNTMPDGIDNIPPADPMKVQFDSLHHYSVGLMSVALFAGLAALFLTVRSLIRR